MIETPDWSLRDGWSPWKIEFPAPAQTCRDPFLLDLYDIFVVSYTPKSNFTVFRHLQGFSSRKWAVYSMFVVMNARKPDPAPLDQQAQLLAEEKYAAKIPRDLQLTGVTPLVMGICEVLKPKLVRKGFHQGDWHHWDLYGEFQVSPHACWPAGGTENKERFWIPMWHDWYRMIIETEGVRGMTFNSEGCVVSLRLVREATQETVALQGTTPLEAIAKATLELFAR